MAYYDTFTVKIKSCSLNNELNEYVKSYIIDEYYDGVEPELLHINYIDGKEITIGAEIVWQKDYYEFNHYPISLIISVNFDDEEFYEDMDVYIDFKNFTHRTNYLFEPITENWDSIEIDDYGSITTN